MTNPYFVGVWRRTGVSWLAVSVFTVAGLCSASGANAPRRDFNIPADRAENSLKRLSEQSGIEVLFPTCLLYTSDAADE